MGYVDFYHFPDPALWPVAGVRRLRDRHPGRRALDPRLVSVDPYRRFDGPVRHAQGHPVLRVDRDGVGAAVSAGAGVLGAAAAAAGQRRRRLLRLVGRADLDRPARRGRRRLYRQVQLLCPARLDDGADSRRRGLGFRRRLAGLSPRRRLGCGADDRAAAHTGGRDLRGAARRKERGRARFRARDALPRASDYISSIMLVAIPAIAVSMAIMSMRNTTYSIQTSVYVVYLDRDRARRHDHRHPVRHGRDCKRVRLALCRARDAAWAIRSARC